MPSEGFVQCYSKGKFHEDYKQVWMECSYAIKAEANCFFGIFTLVCNVCVGDRKERSKHNTQVLKGLMELVQLKYLI